MTTNALDTAVARIESEMPATWARILEQSIEKNADAIIRRPLQGIQRMASSEAVGYCHWLEASDVDERNWPMVEATAMRRLDQFERRDRAGTMTMTEEIILRGGLKALRELLGDRSAQVDD